MRYRFFWLKTDGRIEELSGPRWEELTFMGWGAKHTKLLAFCGRSRVTFWKGKYCFEIGKEQLKKLAEMIG